MHFKKIYKTYSFSCKTDISKIVLFWNVDDLYTKLNLHECGTVVYHRTTDVKVLLGRSSNPTSGYLF